ncbi:MAG: MmcQ/YjbR family DNA-binding protein [Faecalibacterium sp.]|nr:MmcQ/YjbR family DNA-binding protein [Ruminococcus sp.]MCM1391362.1 MmcQ/YjbR family DNA-binding protein [Ruminococcus sp.]MCM1486445.1 MmcQ/YjbR family DNA-binding protein [Faecalibacterium sp.]
MKAKELIDYCLSKTGAYEDYPFGPDVIVIKVRKRIFAQAFILKGHPCATLNCDAMSGQFYRNLYPNVIVRGYHCPPVQQPYFNTFPLDADIPDELITEMIDLSYKTVVGKLPKYVQKELTEE